MQIKINFAPQKAAITPAYNYQLLSAIYRILSFDKEYGDFIHNIGYNCVGSEYKLFTFGQLKGEHKLINKRLIFENGFSLEIRSLSEEFCDIIYNSLTEHRKIKLFDTEYEIDFILKENKSITTNSVDIVTDSPIVCYSQHKSKTVFFSPYNEEFCSVLNNNLKNKCAAANIAFPKNGLKITPLEPSKKVVTQFKKIWITAYSGKFRLETDRQALSLLYDVGLGKRSSQGFGMFDIIT